MKKALTGILLVVFCVLTGEAQTLRLTSPNGGESWEQGTVRAITWTSSGITARVRLILFKDGARLGQIADDLDIAAGSFSWTVGNYGGDRAAAGGGYKVRIRTADGDVVDDSNSSFTITAPGAASLSKLPPTAVKRKEDAVSLPPPAMKKYEPVDLTITKIWSDYAPGVCGLKAEVKCLRGKLSGPVVFSVDYRLGSREIKKISHNLDIGLNEKQTVDLRRVEPIVVWAGDPCGRTCTVTVDSENLIAETDEGNNSLTREVYFFMGNARVSPPVSIGRHAPDVTGEGQSIQLDRGDFLDVHFTESTWLIEMSIRVKNCGCASISCNIDVWQRGRWPNAHELSPRDQEYLAGRGHVDIEGGSISIVQIRMDIYPETSQIEIQLLPLGGPHDGLDRSRFSFGVDVI